MKQDQKSMDDVVTKISNIEQVSKYPETFIDDGIPSLEVPNIHKKTVRRKFILLVGSILLFSVVALGVVFLWRSQGSTEVSYVAENLKSIPRGSLVDYKITDNNGKDVVLSGRVIALPEESIRFNLQNGKIYIKQDNKSYKLKENYIANDTYTSSLMFNDGWYQLGNTQLFVLSDDRSIKTMSDFVHKDSIIDKNQIIKTTRKGERSDIEYIPINERIEFALQVKRGWEAWQTQVSNYINLKNKATPTVYEESIYIPLRNNTLVAVNATNGQKKWEVNFANTMVRVLPEWDDNILFVSTTEDRISALTKEGGDRLWDAESEAYTQLPNDKTKSTFINFFKGKVVGLDKKTGEEKWQVELFDSDNLNPVFKPIGNNLLVYSRGANKLYLLETETGKVVWKIETELNIYDVKENQNLLIVTDGAVKDYYKPDANNDYSISTISVINKQTGHVVWKHKSTKSGRINNTYIDESVIYSVENFSNRSLLTKRDINTGTIIWQYTPTDFIFFPNDFELYEHYLVGSGSYGGNYLEDVGYKMSIFVLDADSGRLIFKKGDFGYASFEVALGKLIVFDKTIKAYNLTSGSKDWSNTISGDVGTSWKPWVFDEDKEKVFAVDKNRIASINVKDGTENWSRNIENSLRSLSLKEDVLYFLDRGKDKLYALNTATGEILWDVKTSDPSGSPYFTDNSWVYTKIIQNVRLQFTQTSFNAYNPQTKQIIPIFDRVTNSDNDLVIKYEDQYIFVFVDNLVTAINYQPG